MSKTNKNNSQTEKGENETMTDLNVGKLNQEEQQDRLDTLIETETSTQGTSVSERDGGKYLVRTINGLTIETRVH